MAGFKLGTVVGGSGLFFTLTCPSCGTSALRTPTRVDSGVTLEELALSVVGHECNPLLVTFNQGRKNTEEYKRGYDEGYKEAESDVKRNVQDRIERGLHHLDTLREMLDS